MWNSQTDSGFKENFQKKKSVVNSKNDKETIIYSLNTDQNHL